jgi:hypothetical protein
MGRPELGVPMGERTAWLACFMFCMYCLTMRGGDGSLGTSGRRLRDVSELDALRRLLAVLMGLLAPRARKLSTFCSVKPLALRNRSAASFRFWASFFVVGDMLGERVARDALTCVSDRRPRLAVALGEGEGDADGEGVADATSLDRREPVREDEAEVDDDDDDDDAWRALVLVALRVAAGDGEGDGEGDGLGEGDGDGERDGDGEGEGEGEAEGDADAAAAADAARLLDAAAVAFFDAAALLAAFADLAAAAATAGSAVLMGFFKGVVVADDPVLPFFVDAPSAAAAAAGDGDSARTFLASILLLATRTKRSNFLVNVLGNLDSNSTIAFCTSLLRAVADDVSFRRDSSELTALRLVKCFLPAFSLVRNSLIEVVN